MRLPTGVPDSGRLRRRALAAARQGLRRRPAFLLTLFLLLVFVLLSGTAARVSASPLTERTADLAAAKARLATLQTELDDLAGAYSHAEARLYELDDSVATLKKDIGRTQGDLAKARAQAQTRLAKLYKSRHSSLPALLEVFFESRDFSAVLDRITLLNRVAVQDQDVFTQVNSHLTKQKTLAQKLASTRAAQKAKTEELQAARDRMEQRISATSAEYTQLKAEVAALAQAEKQAKARQARLAAQAASRAVSSSSGASSGGGAAAAEVSVSADGFVFPVAGAHSFINDWGFARSGGRTHQGTDIMASRGTPAVACVSGTIDRTSYNSGLGGTTIWLDGDNGVSYYYAHLDSIAVSAGTHVSAGQVIGGVGNSGNARGGACHLHFQMHPGGGGAINPYPTLRAAG